MKKVIMYTLSTCPWCRKTKQLFKDKNIPFEYTDYDLATEDVQEKIMKEIQESGAQLAFPYVKINGSTAVGYNPEKFLQLLGVK
jgi:glutaredoxin